MLIQNLSKHIKNDQHILIKTPHSTSFCIFYSLYIMCNYVKSSSHIPVIFNASKWCSVWFNLLASTGDSGISKPRASLSRQLQLHPALLCHLAVPKHSRRQTSVVCSQSHTATFLPVQPLPQSQPKEIVVRNVLRIVMPCVVSVSEHTSNASGPISAPNQNGWEWRGAKPGQWPCKCPCLSKSP